MLKFSFRLSSTTVGLHFNKVSGDVGSGSKITEDSALSLAEGDHPGVSFYVYNPGAVVRANVLLDLTFF